MQFYNRKELIKTFQEVIQAITKCYFVVILLILQTPVVARLLSFLYDIYSSQIIYNVSYIHKNLKFLSKSRIMKYAGIDEGDINESTAKARSNIVPHLFDLLWTLFTIVLILVGYIRLWIDILRMFM